MTAEPAMHAPVPGSGQARMIKTAITILRRVLGIRTPRDRCSCGVSMSSHPRQHAPLCRVRYDWAREAAIWDAARRPDGQR